MTQTSAPDTLIAHPMRNAVLAEVHARPFQLVKSPRRFLHFAFMLDEAQANQAVADLAAFCTARDLPAPAPSARHHRVEIGKFVLRFELHAEFCTYTLGCDGETPAPFSPAADELKRFTQFLPQPGPHLVSVDLHLVKQTETLPELESLFDPASLAASRAANAKAVIATDFRVQHDGYVRILVIDCGMTNSRAGALTQRLLEIETYRTLALLALPQAQRISPNVHRIEEALTQMSSNMVRIADHNSDRALLDDLTRLSAELEAESASASFRFRAASAYYEIVRQRLEAIDEKQFKDHSSLASFLSRRMAPAMRTCTMLQGRQAKLSGKLERITNLLRTRVDVEIEQQNQHVLKAMNERARMQLRLQQTVEGLSVAAISYYVVGLAGYVLKGLKEIGLLPLDVGLATALVVPLALLGVWLVVRSIHRAHADSPDPHAKH